MNWIRFGYISLFIACGEKADNQTTDTADTNNADVYCEGTSTLLSEDADCDGVLTTDDCDDNDPTSSVVATDADCDSIPTIEDCDDNDASVTNTNINDADCDLVITAEDCDDSDASVVNTNVNDADCDGVLTTDDCDDNDAMSIYDMDCDGVLTTDDCNDNDPTLLATIDDTDCDGVIDSVCEALQEPLQDESYCYTDADGDGFGDQIDAGEIAPGCFFASVTGETWDYSDIHHLSGFEDGVQTFYLDHDNYDTTPDWVQETQTDTFCPSPNTSLVEFTFTGGWGPGSFELYYDSGFETEPVPLQPSGSFVHAETWPSTHMMTVFGSDCDDTDPFTFPGSAELDSTTTCMKDADGDGYGEPVIQTCFRMDLYDGNYLGWDGNSISLLEDGVVMGTYFPDHSNNNYTSVFEHCVALETTQVDFVYNNNPTPGSEWFEGTTFGLWYQTDSGLISVGGGNGYGSTVHTFEFNGVLATSGVPFFTETAPFSHGMNINGGTDADDSDPSVH